MARVEQTSIPTAAAMSEFSRFFGTAAGKRLFEHQRYELSRVMPSVVGYNCLQFSVNKGVQLCDSSSIGHYVKVGYAPGLDEDNDDDCWVDMRSLPIASDCVDIAILHHVLDFSRAPHQVLREVDRTLTEGGYLVLVTFQPWSSWSIAKRYWAAKHLVDPRVIKQCQPVSSARISDWLRLLNFDVLQQQANYFLSQRLDRLFGGLGKRVIAGSVIQKALSPLSTYSIVVARKRRSLVNPLVKPWRVSPRRSPGMATNPRISADCINTNFLSTDFVYTDLAYTDKAITNDNAGKKASVKVRSDRQKTSVE